ncbi:hypothetical protein OQA88_13006 [Cercophora sp. LCS_1]
MDHAMDQPIPISGSIEATAPFSNRPPSPPYIHVPPFMGMDTAGGKGLFRALTLTPSPSNLGSAGLTEAAFQTVASYGPLAAKDNANQWVYEARRQIQQVLPYMYLGPASAVRDRQFIANEGITMMLALRNARFPTTGFVIVDKVAAELGIARENIDISGHWELAGAFTRAVGLINAHLELAGPRGRVLVVCETGNERSAAVVGAYIMTVYAVDLVMAVQFVGLKRFCVMFDDDTKNAMQVYGDILRARRDVQGFAGVEQKVEGGKRRVDEVLVSEENGMVVDEVEVERYTGRGFVPFVERG